MRDRAVWLWGFRNGHHLIAGDTRGLHHGRAPGGHGSALRVRERGEGLGEELSDGEIRLAYDTAPYYGTSSWDVSALMYLFNDQWTAELFYRLQVAENFQFTPSVQLVVDPALNPDARTIWVAGLRARLTF